MDAFVLDGASGTLMESYGLVMHPTLWSAVALLPENHKYITQYYQAYLDAGANVLTTPTYQATFAAFDGLLSAAQLADQFKFAVDEARRLATEHSPNAPAKVAGSIGPYGAVLLGGEEFSGDYGAATVEDLCAFHIARFRAFVNAQPDYIVFETIANRKECEAIIRVLHDEPPPVPVWVSFSIKWGHDGENVALADGTPLADIAALEWPASVAMVGVNCFPPHYASRAIDELKAFDRPLIVYPNSGEVYDGHTKEWAPAPLGEQAQLTPEVVRSWYDRGVRGFGGCCRTGPAYIASLAEAVHSALGTADGSAA